VPHQSNKPPTFTRDIRQIYQIALHHSVAERILAAKSITLGDVKRGVNSFRLACQTAIMLQIPLKINHHMAMHYEMVFRLHGPAYAWWLFAFERFNGYMEDIKLNGHAGEEMELTCARGWVGMQRLYELVHFMSISALRLMGFIDCFLTRHCFAS
jgi:hypothetical protein